MHICLDKMPASHEPFPHGFASRLRLGIIQALLEMAINRDFMHPAV